jgi:hypothetical protein
MFWESAPYFCALHHKYMYRLSCLCGELSRKFTHFNPDRVRPEQEQFRK